MKKKINIVKPVETTIDKSNDITTNSTKSKVLIIIKNPSKVIF